METNNELENNKTIILRDSEIDFFIENFPCAFSLYLYLRQNGVTWDREKYNVGKDKFDLYNRYFKAQDKIAVSVTQSVIACRFNVGIKTIGRWIKKLKSLGVIKIEQIKFGRGENHKIYNIYVLGELIGGEEKYYIDLL